MACIPCLIPVFTMYDAKFKVEIKSCARVKLRCFKYLSLILRKENFFRENWLILWGIWGEAELF